ncbi:MAG: hypothetical protein ABSB10_00580 [Candidatus Bathyarchaeia archaeon]|jgi:hypothetical protein
MSLEGTTALVSDRYLITAVVDTGATVVAGNVVYISAAGFIPAVKPTAGVRKDVIGVALTGGVAGKKITVICRGLVRVVASGAITMGARISSSTAGKVAAVVVMTAPTGGSSTYYTTTIQAAFQTELDKSEQWIGRALTAATNDGDVIYALLSCIP